LQVARENQLSKFGTVSLDGSKNHANGSRHNASWHSALSYGHIEKIEAQLKAVVQELQALVEAADQSSVPDGVSLPEEIKRREDRLAAIAAAKAKIEARANERFEREKAGYDTKMAERGRNRCYGQSRVDGRDGAYPPGPSEG
jgi:hypothetical protein